MIKILMLAEWHDNLADGTSVRYLEGRQYKVEPDVAERAVESGRATENASLDTEPVPVDPDNQELE